MQTAPSISGIGGPTWQSTIIDVTSQRKASCAQLFSNKEVHRKWCFTNHTGLITTYNNIHKKASLFVKSLFFFVDFFFLATELSNSDSYIHFNNFLDSDTHSLTILRSFDLVSLRFALPCLLQLPWRVEHAFQWLLCPRGSEACPSLFTVNANKPSVNRQLQHPSKRTSFKNIVYLSEHKISSYSSK